MTGSDAAGPASLLDVVDAAVARLLDVPDDEMPSAHAGTLARVGQAITEAGAGQLHAGDEITDGDAAAAMVVADGGATCLLVCIPVPAAMTALPAGQTRPVRIRVDTELAVDLAAVPR